MKLHILNRSPVTSGVYRQALAAMASDDLLVLIEDAVQGVVPSMIGSFDVASGRVFALREDMESRGLGGRQDSSVQLVDIDGLVALTEKTTQSVSWF